MINQKLCGKVANPNQMKKSPKYKGCLHKKYNSTICPSTVFLSEVLSAEKSTVMILIKKPSKQTVKHHWKFRS